MDHRNLLDGAEPLTYFTSIMNDQTILMPKWNHLVIGRIRRLRRQISQRVWTRWARCRSRAHPLRSMESSLNGPRRILVVETRHLGDVLFATPAIRSLKLAFPHAHLAVLICPGSEAVIRHNPAVDEILLFDKNHFPKMVEILADRQFDLACLLDRDDMLAQLAYLAGIPRRIGYDRQSCVRYLTDAVPREQKGTSEIHWSVRLAYAAGGRPVEERTDLFLERNNRMAMEKWNLEPRSFIILHPGSDPAVVYKRWPAQRFAEVARRLIERGHRVVITGLASENILKSVFPSHPLLSILVGGTALQDLICLINACRLLITNDTGPSHIAAALNRPCIAVTGFADPKIYHPYPEPHRAIYHPIPCSPCFGSRFDPQDCPFHSCIKAVTVDEVVTQATDLIAG